MKNLIYILALLLSFFSSISASVVNQLDNVTTVEVFHYDSYEISEDISSLVADDMIYFNDAYTVLNHTY